MPRPGVGNPGNKGGGRKSAFEELKEAVWHSDKWEHDSDVPELQAKLKTGKYSVRDVFLAKALQGNEKILGIFANKLLADLVDINGKIAITPLIKEIQEEQYNRFFKRHGKNQAG